MQRALEARAGYDGNAIQPGGHARLLAQAVQIERQPVAQVDARGRFPREFPAKGQTRDDFLIPGFAQASGNIEPIAGPGTCARQCPSVLDCAHEQDATVDLLVVRQIAAHESRSRLPCKT